AKQTHYVFFQVVPIWWPFRLHLDLYHRILPVYSFRINPVLSFFLLNAVESNTHLLFVVHIVLLLYQQSFLSLFSFALIYLYVLSCFIVVLIYFFYIFILCN